MLRIVTIAIAVACLIGALYLVHIVWFGALELALLGVAILVGTFLEGHYRARRAGAGFEKTGERFVDPTTGKVVEVRYDPNTGERAYVDAGS
jgi:hypothetical protein